MPEVICSQCDALYHSERELRDHMGIVHRMFNAAINILEPLEPQEKPEVEAQTDEFSIQRGEDKTRDVAHK